MKAKNPADDAVDEKPTQIKNWSEIVAENDTNKHIITKFMRRGFTSLSAEELAATMISPCFTADFTKNTTESWLAEY